MLRIGTENAPIDECIVVVSDLHLGSGRDEASTPANHLELFHHDAAFARFVENLGTQSEARNGNLRLVILGDLFDFPRVPGSGFTAKNSDADLVDRTRRIIAGHPQIFNALRAFVELGFRIDILPGNHDLALMRSPVQGVIQESIDINATRRIQFHPWIFHIPGLLFAEHGNQYHDINSFQHWLDASKSPLTKTCWPIGARFDEYFIDLLKRPNPTSEPWPQSFPGVMNVLVRNPWSLVQTMPMHLKFVSALVPELIFSKFSRRAERREEYRNTMAASAQAETGISANLLCEVDKVAEQIASNLGRRMARGIRILIQSKVGLRRERATDVNHLGLPSTADQRMKLLQRVAGEIDSILGRSSHHVPFYVFGHTHLPDNSGIQLGQREIRCLNAGSWLNQAPAIDDPASATNGFTFIQVERSAISGTPTAHLLAWNDSTRSITSL